MSAWLEAHFGIHLQDPWFLLLAAPLPLLWWWRRRLGAPALPFAPFALATAGDGARPRRLRARLLWLPGVLQTGALLLLLLALARPVQRAELPQLSLGIDIMLCLDISSSMQARDLDPQHSRLQVARSAAAEFVRGRPDDRIGLIEFARFPDVVCPPTLDHAALLQLLAAVTQVPGDGPEDATGIGTAVARSAQVLQRGVAKAKVVILLTDGEENVATDLALGEIAPRHSAQLCQQLGVRVYAIAIGLGKADASGAVQPLDTRDIDQLAAQSGGQAFTARDAAALGSVYAAIDGLEKVQQEAPRYAIEERFVPCLLAAALVYLAAVLLRVGGLEVLP